MGSSLEQLSCISAGPWLVQAEHQPRPAETSGPSHGWPLALQSLYPRYSHYVEPSVGSLTAFALVTVHASDAKRALFQAQTVTGSDTPKVLERGWKQLPSTDVKLYMIKTSKHSFWRLERITGFHSSAIAAREVVGLNQNETGAGCAGTTSTKQAEQESWLLRSWGGSFAKITIICVTQCSECIASPR